MRAHQARGVKSTSLLGFYQFAAGDLGPGFEFLGRLEQRPTKAQHHAKVKDLEDIRVGPGSGPARLLPEFPGPVIGLEHHRLELVLVPFLAPARVKNEDLVEPAYQGVSDLHFRAQIGVTPGLALAA